MGSLGAERVRVTFDDIRSAATGDTGFLGGIAIYAALDRADKVLRSMESRLTWVLARTDGRWRIVHEHTSSPIRGADGTGMLRRE